MIFDAPQVVAVRHRRKCAVEWKDLETVPRQIQLTDDLGTQQRYDVRADGELETGEHFLSDCCATDDVASLEHEHLASGFSQIRGSGKTVVAGADDNRVVVHW